MSTQEIDHINNEISMCQSKLEVLRGDLYRVNTKSVMTIDQDRELKRTLEDDMSNIESKIDALQQRINWKGGKA